MPLDVVRFAQSDLVAFAPPDAVVAAILLWGASWHQRPAASLTNDDRALANLAGYGRAVGEWLKVKDEALRGFVECSDGRLYHPVVAEKARDAWTGKLRQRHRTYLAAIRQHNGRKPDDQRQGHSFEEWLAGGQPTQVQEAPRQPEQDVLPLAAPAEPNRVTRDNTDESRVTEGGCHARVTRETPSKGQGDGEGQGEGEGEGDSIVLQTPPAPDLWAGDLLATTNALASLAGISIMKETARVRQLDVVKAWKAEGIDIASVIVPIIERDRRDNPDQDRWSLVFYDTAVRRHIATAGKVATPATPEERRASLASTISLYRRMGRNDDADALQRQIDALG